MPPVEWYSIQQASDELMKLFFDMTVKHVRICGLSGDSTARRRADRAAASALTQ